MQYIAMRSFYGILASQHDPQQVVAVFARSAVVDAIRHAPLASEALEMLPPDMEEISAYLGEAMLLDVDVEIDPSESEMDMLMALTSLSRNSWLELDEHEYEALCRLKERYPLQRAELRSLFYRSSPYQIFLYIETPEYSQYWFDDDLIAQLLRAIGSDVPDEIRPVDIPQDVLEYPVEVTKLPDGQYIACVPYLGRWTFQADGATVQEALDSLQEVYREVSRLVVERGGRILPPPDRSNW